MRTYLLSKRKLENFCLECTAKSQFYGGETPNFNAKSEQGWTLRQDFFDLHLFLLFILLQ